MPSQCTNRTCLAFGKERSVSHFSCHDCGHPTSYVVRPETPVTRRAYVNSREWSLPPAGDPIKAGRADAVVWWLRGALPDGCDVEVAELIERAKLDLISPEELTAGCNDLLASVGKAGIASVTVSLRQEGDHGIKLKRGDYPILLNLPGVYRHMWWLLGAMPDGCALDMEKLHRRGVADGLVYGTLAPVWAYLNRCVRQGVASESGGKYAVAEEASFPDRVTWLLGRAKPHA